MIHNLLLLSVIFISSIFHTEAIQCYECSQVRNTQTGSKARLCSHFDYSKNFIVDCPYSTMCEKKLSSVNITGQINVTSRGCALQKYEYQKYDRAEKRWEEAIEVQEPYKEGCITIDNKGLKISYTQHCYCRGYLCNSATKNSCTFDSTVINLVVVVFIFKFLPIIHI